ncbi:MAG: dihydroneopterin aldolase, partial [Proteobacteria bacterium]|nr:dihydroneopterin aldolase [Pseudomonadota bacterium]
RLENVVDYETIVQGVKTIVAAGHINLVETLAERVAGLCLSDARVEAARVRIEKLNVLPEAASVGVEIERVRPRR